MLLIVKRTVLAFLCVLVFIFITGCQKNYYNPDKQVSQVVENDAQIVVNQTEITMGIGEVSQIKANFLSQTTVGKITFKCADTNIATVDENGDVLSKSAGKTIITVASVGVKTPVLCTVIVQPVKKMDISGIVPLVSEADKSYTITVSFENCQYPSVKVIADCGGGTIKGENTTESFDSKQTQVQVIGKTTVEFNISESKDVDDIRIIGLDKGMMIDCKEYIITRKIDNTSSD